MKKTVFITQEVEIDLDESKLTEEMMAEFREHFYQFNTIEDHIKHLAWVALQNGSMPDFVEGYGEVKDFGITATVGFTESEIV